MASDEEKKQLSPLVPELIALLGGIMSAVLLVMPLSTLLIFLGVLVAPIVEEISKVCGLYYLALYYPRALSTKKRGVILGGLSGLGFAFTENLFYFIRAEMGVFGEEAVAIMPLMRIIPIFIHVFCSALVGVGLASFAQHEINGYNLNTRGVLARLQLSLFFPLLIIGIGLHLIYNLAAFQLGLIGVIGGLGLTYIVFYRLNSHLPDKLTNISRTNFLELLMGVSSEKEKNRLFPQQTPEQHLNYAKREAGNDSVYESDALKPCLIGVSGAFKGQVIDLDFGEIIIGRDPQQSHLVYFEDTEISRKHCLVYYDKQSQYFILRDLSTNGTFLLTGEQLEHGKLYYLQSGSRFYFRSGREVFEVNFISREN